MPNRLTFLLTSLILIFALVALPAMAETLSATWTDDLDGDGTADDSGWNVTLTYDTAPATDFSLPAIKDIKNKSLGLDYNNPPDDTTTEFAFDVPVSSSASEADRYIIIGNFRRVTLENGQPLAETSIALPKLKSITAPTYVNGNFEATITFEAEAAAAPGQPPSTAIGPAEGLLPTDILVFSKAFLKSYPTLPPSPKVVSVSEGPEVYTVEINPGEVSREPVTIELNKNPPFRTTPNTGTYFPRHPPVTLAEPDHPMAVVIYEVVPPIITPGFAHAIPVNNKGPEPSAQSGEGRFYITFEVEDEGQFDHIAGVDASSINAESFTDTLSVLSFSDARRMESSNNRLVKQLSLPSQQCQRLQGTRQTLKWSLPSIEHFRTILTWQTCRSVRGPVT